MIEFLNDETLFSSFVMDPPNMIAEGNIILGNNYVYDDNDDGEDVLYSENNLGEDNSDDEAGFLNNDNNDENSNNGVDTTSKLTFRRRAIQSY